MKRTLILSILILNAITLAAIKPNRVYSYTPDKLDLTYEEFKVKTDDGFTLNVWHLPSEGDGAPVIISQSDAGKGKQVVKTFDCEHISGFFRYPEEYTTAIVDFLK